MRTVALDADPACSDDAAGESRVQEVEGAGLAVSAVLEAFHGDITALARGWADSHRVRAGHKFCG